jgi:hypothetical protein
MKNEEIQFNFEKINFEEKTKNDKIFLSKKHFKSSNLNYEDFEDGLNVSEIEKYEDDNKFLKRTKNINNNNNNMNIDEDFSEDLDNSNESEMTSRKFSDSIHIDFLNDKTNNNNDKKFKKTKTKEDLNNTPLPLFDCIYCTNEKIVFNNFINNSLSDKYLFLTSIYDMNDLNKLISYQPLIDKNGKNNKLLNIVIKNTEYISQFICQKNNIIYFKSNLFNNLCEQYKAEYQRLIKQKLEEKLVRKKIDFYFKGMNIITKNSVNNKCLFNSTNSLINYYSSLSGIVEPIPQNLIYIKNNCTIASGSNNSINFNSLSLNNNENNKENNNLLDDAVEKIEKKDESANYAEDKDEIMDFLKFDLTRKISKNDIKWDNKYYDIYNPEISSDENEEIVQNNNNHNLVLNNNKFIANNNKYLDNNINKVEIRYNKFQLKNPTFKSNKQTIDKFHDNKSSLEKTIKNHYVVKDSKNNTTIMKDINSNINRSQGLKNLLNQKYGISFIKSFNSSSTIDNSYNINRNSFGSKNKNKIYDNKFKNKKNSIKYNSNHNKIDYNNNSSKNKTNYSIGVSIPSKLNTSFKSNNFKKYNCSNTGAYFKKKNNNIIYDYKLKNKRNRINIHKNSIKASSYFQNKSITYKYNSNANKKKKNRINKYGNISHLNINKSNYYKNKKKEHNKNCKSYNKNSIKKNYIDYNLLDSKENKSLFYNNSNNNCLKDKNIPLKSGFYFTSNKFVKNSNINNNYNNNYNNNNKLHHNKSIIFQNNTNNISNSSSNGKIIFGNQNNSSVFNNNFEKKIIKQYYHINNKNTNKTDFYFKRKK